MGDRNQKCTRMRLGARNTVWTHGVGILLSIVALIIGGLDNPDIGFPVAVAIVVALGIPSAPPPISSEIAENRYGSVLNGGIKQGIFIKCMFSIALLYSGVFLWVFGTGADGISNLLLGTALAVSSIGTAIDARALKNRTVRE